MQIVMGLKFDRCPKAWLAEQDEANDYITDWRWHKQGHLPHTGGQLDQDPKTMQALEILDDEAAMLRKHFEQAG